MNRILVIVMLLLALSGPTFAQDATSEPTAPAEVTPEPPVIVVPAPAEGFNFWQFLSGVATGVLTTLATVLGLVGRLKNDTAALNSIEWLGKSVPADVLLKLNKVGTGLVDAGEVVVKVTDGLPNEVPATRGLPG